MGKVFDRKIKTNLNHLYFRITFRYPSMSPKSRKNKTKQEPNMYEKTKNTFGLSSSKKIIVAEGQLHSPEEFFKHFSDFNEITSVH